MVPLVLAVLLTADGGVDAGLKLDAGVKDAGPVLAAMPTRLPDGGMFMACKQTQAVCFSPEGYCDLLVAQVIDRTAPNGSIDVLIYSINRPSIVDALLRVRARGAMARLIVDSTQLSDPKEQAQLQRLLAAGVPVKRDTRSGSMHMKVVIRDSQEFLTGSFNFTNNASENNDENMLVWDCQRVALVYKAKFEALWAKYKDATDLILKDGG